MKNVNNILNYFLKNSIDSFGDYLTIYQVHVNIVEKISKKLLQALCIKKMKE